jgi:hypothetical protein
MFECELARECDSVGLSFLVFQRLWAAETVISGVILGPFSNSVNLLTNQMRAYACSHAVLLDS